MSFTTPLSVRPEFQTIMLRQQLLLPVILYDWFSHTIWLVNNCAEDIKRTPAPSYQHHCQWARAPTAKKERKKEKINRFHCILVGLRWLTTGGQLVSVLSDYSSCQNTLTNANTLIWTDKQQLHTYASHCVHKGCWGLAVCNKKGEKKVFSDVIIDIYSHP